MTPHRHPGASQLPENPRPHREEIRDTRLDVLQRVLNGLRALDNDPEKPPP
jgi:hypothetical protein